MIARARNPTGALSSSRFFLDTKKSAFYTGRDRIYIMDMAVHHLESCLVSIRGMVVQKA